MLQRLLVLALAAGGFACLWSAPQAARDYESRVMVMRENVARSRMARATAARVPASATPPTRITGRVNRPQPTPASQKPVTAVPARPLVQVPAAIHAPGLLPRQAAVVRKRPASADRRQILPVVLPADIAPGVYRIVSHRGDVGWIQLQPRDVPCTGGAPQASYVALEGTESWHFIRIEAAVSIPQSELARVRVLPARAETAQVEPAQSPRVGLDVAQPAAIRGNKKFDFTGYVSPQPESTAAAASASPR